MKTLFIGALSLALLALSGTANAIPIMYEFEMPAFDSGFWAGQTSTLDVVVDNGNPTAINQSYLNTQITAYDITVGGTTYSFSAELEYLSSGIFITTDAFSTPTLDLSAAGNICARDVTDPDRSQLCSGSFFFNYSLKVGDNGSILVDPNLIIVGTQIPEPSTFLLFGLGLIGLLRISRRGRNRNEIANPLAI